MRKHIGKPVVAMVAAIILAGGLATAQTAKRASASTAVVQKHLTVDQVIGMASARVSDSVIVARLKKEDTAFDLSPEDLIRLKNAKVSDEVVKAMLDPKAPSEPPPSASITSFQMAAMAGRGALTARASGATPEMGAKTSGDENDPLTPHDSGIYLLTKDRDGKPKMTPLERASYQGSKNGGTLGYAMTYGIKKIKTKAVIPGTRAGIRVNDAAPVFYFYFDDKQTGLGKTSFGMSNISSPNQFALLRLEIKKSDRETIIGQFGSLGGSSGSDMNSAIQFKSERLRAGLYKVSIPEIKSGEYCFMASSGPQMTGMAAAYGGMTSATDIFDFGADID